LERNGCRPRTATVPAGENSKSAAVLTGLYSEALAAGLGRNDWVVAVGGGVVGDLAGMLAGTWLRGIRLLQVPTSLLAMVDSSVGGKTGINLPEGKNLVGVFHQPAAVWTEVGCLATLPAREIRCGFAEIVKTAVLADAEFFDRLEDPARVLGDPDSPEWMDWIARSCRIKAGIVAADEREAGPRAALNFGHTLGHALETVTAYGRWSHGEAVALGMIYAARLARRLTGFPERDFERLESLLARAGLPVRVSGLEWAEVRRAMGVDKKSESGAPRFVLPVRIGEVRTGCPVPEDVLTEVWNACGQ
jgi:3-dehydroquinate synthase